MKKKSINWLYALEYELHPHRLKVSLQQANGLNDLINGVEMNIMAFKPCFAEWLGSSYKLATTALLQVVITSNALHDFLTKMTSAWEKSPLSQDIRYAYRSTLHALEALLEDCGKLDNDLLSRIPISAHSLPPIRIRLRERLASIIPLLDNDRLDGKLSGILIKRMNMLIGSKGLSRSDVDYVNSLLDNLEALDNFSKENVEEILYHHDFNSSAFYNYWVQGCNHALDNAPGLHRQLEVLIAFEERLNSIRPMKTGKWAPLDISIHTQLKEFLKEKKAHIHERINLQREEIKDRKLAESEERMPVNLSVAQFGLTIRLFIEDGTLPQADIGATFAYFARHFRTPKAPFISPESLQKKSTDVESATISKVKGQLIGMVNRLNEYRSGA